MPKQRKRTTKALIDFWEKVAIDERPQTSGPSSDSNTQAMAEVKPEDLSDTPTLDQLVTLYHITNAPWWATQISEAKQKGAEFKDLKNPIDPYLSLNKRNKGDIEGDGRGGDDLGPGFYVGDSPEFADYYGKNYDKNNPASVMKFQIPKSELDKLNRKDIAPDDEETFQDFMKRGFFSYDGKDQHPPELDQKPTGHDLLTGPINDISQTKATEPDEKGMRYHQGGILKFGDRTPLQYNFATEKGVETLYGKSKSIETIVLEAWKAQRKTT
jgi:hypothetical protein